MRDIYEKPTANVVFSCERLPSRIKNKPSIATFATSIQHFTESFLFFKKTLTKIWQEKETKPTQIGKEEFKLH